MTKQVVVIDKEDLDKLISKTKKLIENTLGTTQEIHKARLSELETIEALSTTITLDDDIEKRANDLFSVNEGFFVSLDREGLIKFATEQQIISEMKMKGWIDCKNHPPKQR